MRTRLIIFDFDGTLADTTATILSTYRKVIREMELESRTDAACQATIGLPLKEGFRQLYPGFAGLRLDECVDAYRRIFNENKRKFPSMLYPGVKDTLDELYRRGMDMTIASSRNSSSLLEFCRENGIRDYFRLLLGADDVVDAKPHPEPVLKTLEILGREAERTLVVGDMPVDMAMGNGAHCRTVGVTYGNADRDELIGAGATFVIDSFPELLEYIRI